MKRIALHCRVWREWGRLPCRIEEGAYAGDVGKAGKCRVSRFDVPDATIRGFRCQQRSALYCTGEWGDIEFGTCGSEGSRWAVRGVRLQMTHQQTR